MRILLSKIKYEDKEILKAQDEHLLTYFTKTIEFLMKIVIRLSFFKILINNYDGTINMKKNIMRNKIKLYICKKNANIDVLIKNYNEYILNDEH